MSKEEKIDEAARLVGRPQQVLFAQTPPGMTIGAVSDAAPSSLALLAAGVAGMAARRAHAERIKSQQASATES